MVDTLLEARAAECFRLDDAALREEGAKPLPEWWVSPDDPAFSEMQERVMERLASRDWRVLLELLAHEGDLRAIGILEDGPDVDPEVTSSSPNDKDQRLLWHLGHEEDVVTIASQLGWEQEALSSAMDRLRELLGARERKCVEERLTPYLDLARWRTERHQVVGLEGEEWENAAAAGGRTEFRPTHPTPEKRRYRLVVDTSTGADGDQITQVSFRMSAGAKPRVSWRFTFAPEDEAQRLLEMGLDRTLMGTARLLFCEGDADFRALLDRLLHRCGTFEPDGAYSVSWRGNLLRIARYVVLVDTSPKQ